MALSGSYYKNIGSHWRLQLEWTATQNIAGNTSTVTSKLYWINLDAYGIINSSATKSGSVTVGGTAYSFSGAGIASLSSKQKRLLKTSTAKVITHNADGTGSVAFNATFNAEVTLGGTYYGAISLGAKTFTLNTIPRASSISSSANWTAGNNLAVSIGRASSSFTHTVRVYADGTLVATRTGIGASTTVTFTDAENKIIFTELAQGTSKVSRVEVDTYSGSTKIGSTVTKAGTVKAPSSSDVGTIDGQANNPNSDGYHQYAYVDQTLNIGITRYHTKFTHTVQIIVGSYTKSFTGITDKVAWTPTTAEKTSIFAQMTDVNSKNAVIRVYTYFSGVQVQAYTDSSLALYVRNSNPTFAGGMTYKDISAVPTGVTKTTAQIIQNYSDLQVTIPLTVKATALNGATMKSYLITVNGVQKTAPYSTTADVVVSMGKVTAGVNVTLSVKAVDSRGNSTEKTMQVTIIPYAPPTLTRSASRKNNFEASTILKLAGTFTNSLGNALQYVRYRTKLKTATTYGGWVNFTYTTTGATFKATDVTVTLDNTLSYDVEFYVQDKLGTTSQVVAVSSGEPIMFIDTAKRAMGINKFPTTSNGLDVKGNITADGGIDAGGYLNINLVADAGLTTVNKGLKVADSSGNSIKIDSNEIQAVGTSNQAQILYINNEGGSVKLWNNNTTVHPNMVFENGYIVNEGRISLSYKNGWAHYSASVSATSGYTQGCYWKDKNGIVHLAGLVKGGTLTEQTVIATLPVGYRPFGTEAFIQIDQQGKADVVRVDVSQDGDISVQYSGSWISLSGISFKAER